MTNHTIDVELIGLLKEKLADAVVPTSQALPFMLKIYGLIQQIKSLCFKHIGKRLLGALKYRKLDEMERNINDVTDLEMFTQCKGYNAALDDIRKIIEDEYLSDKEAI